jgi:DNA-directed RNA polymerase subunit K/omega
VLKSLENNKDTKEFLVMSNHTTSDYLTPSEKARLIGERAKQIEITGETYIPNIADYKIDSSAQIAELELDLGVIPFLVVRQISNTSIVEIIDPKKAIK